MPTIVQTHLIIEPNWAEVTKKAKSLEHIMCRCDPLATTSPIVPGAGAVPSLYSHIEQSYDQDTSNIPKPFKNARGEGGKKSSKAKAKPQQQQQQQQQQPPPQPPEQEEQCEEVNNYYHNENYRGNSGGCQPYRGQQSGRRPYKGSQYRGWGQKTITEADIEVTMGNFTTLVETIITPIIMVVTEAHVDVAMEVIITDSIMHMMMAHRCNNMVCNVHSVEVLITLLNTV